MYSAFVSSKTGMRDPWTAIALALAVALLVAGCGVSANSESAMSATLPTAEKVDAPQEADKDRKQAERLALKQANLAYQANRIVAPAEDNAVLHALRALNLNSESVGAQELLSDIMPLASSRVEATLAAGDWQEADRMIALLEQAMPDSLTTRTLRRQWQTSTPDERRGAVAEQR